MPTSWQKENPWPVDPADSSRKNFLLAKIEKETGRIVGFLSKGKRRWLPALSSKHMFFMGSEEQINEVGREFQDKYDWENSDHPYRYKVFIG